MEVYVDSYREVCKEVGVALFLGLFAFTRFFIQTLKPINKRRLREQSPSRQWHIALYAHNVIRP